MLLDKLDRQMNPFGLQFGILQTLGDAREEWRVGLLGQTNGFRDIAAIIGGVGASRGQPFGHGLAMATQRIVPLHLLVKLARFLIVF